MDDYVLRLKFFMIITVIDQFSSPCATYGDDHKLFSSWVNHS